MPRAVWSDEAIDSLLDLAVLDIRQARRVRQAIRQFSRSEGGDVKKLQGRREEWRLRVGDWRVIFHYEGDSIEIDRVANRRDIYE